MGDGFRKNNLVVFSVFGGQENREPDEDVLMVYGKYIFQTRAIRALQCEAVFSIQ